MAIYGYGRVSTEKDQSPERQINSLVEYGVPKENIYIDKMSRKNFERSAYLEVKNKLKENDSLIFHELDRFGRNYERGVE